MGALFEDLRLFTINGGTSTRLEIGGEIDLGSVDALRDELGMIVESGTGNVEVDMSAVSFCDSTGLCALIAARQHLDTRGRRLSIINASSHVARLLDVSGLTDSLSSTG
jgi:anti-sigma B factor antagonist